MSITEPASMCLLYLIAKQCAVAKDQKCLWRHPRPQGNPQSLDQPQQPALENKVEECEGNSVMWPCC